MRSEAATSGVRSGEFVPKGRAGVAAAERPDDTAPPDEGPEAECQVHDQSSSECGRRLGILEGLRESLDLKCGLPDKVPYSVIAEHDFCAGSQEECREYNAVSRPVFWRGGRSISRSMPARAA